MAFRTHESFVDTFSHTETDSNSERNLLHWPSPLSASSYALVDSPRFFVPEWAVVPWQVAGASVDPALQSTNGYDFGNNVMGDTYVHLLGSDMDGWTHAREEFLQLAGRIALLPDYAYGTWWTWWIAYTEAQAKSYLKSWEDHDLPLDVWLMDSGKRLQVY